jgi:hypothetical protein
MVCRSLFEDMVVAYWAHENGLKAIEQWQGHLAPTSELVRSISEKRGQPMVSDLELGQRLTVVERERWERVFGPHAPRLWTGGTLHAMVKGIAESWPEEERALLWQMNDLRQRFNNLVLHNTPYVLNAPLGGQEGGEAGVSHALYTGSLLPGATGQNLSAR